MLPSINHRVEGEEKLLSIILSKNLPIESIYLIGICQEHKVYESVFLKESSVHEQACHYYLLVLVNSSGTLKTNEIQSAIENVCLPVMPVTTLVFDTSYFNRLVSAKNVFACTIKDKGKMIYIDQTCGTESLADITDLCKETEEAGWHTFNCLKVSEFMAGAELYRIRKNYIMCAFMIHQAAEHALNGIFYSRTGISIKTHNIEKLVRCCTIVDRDIPLLFPSCNPEVVQHLKLLQSSYINARYVKNFLVREKDIVMLNERVRALYVLLQKCTD